MGIVNKMEDSPLRSAIHQRGADRYCLQQCVELVHAEIGLPQDCAQRTAIELFVVGDYELSEGIIPPQDDVGAVLAFLVKADFGERLDAVVARKPGQLAHTATTNVPKCSSGTGRPSSCKAAM